MKLLFCFVYQVVSRLQKKLKPSFSNLFFFADSRSLSALRLLGTRHFGIRLSQINYDRREKTKAEDLSVFFDKLTDYELMFRL